MLENLDSLNMTVSCLSAAFGGLLVTFLVKHYIKNNDKLHDRTYTSINNINKEISNLKGAINNVINKISYIDVLESDIRGHNKKISYLEARLDNAGLSKFNEYKN